MQCLAHTPHSLVGARATFVGSTPTEVEIFIWILSPLWSKKTCVAATDERNIIILHRKIVHIQPIYEVYCSVWRRYICYLSILYWDASMVKWLRTSDVGSTPTEVEIFKWIMSPLWLKKTSVAATDERNIIILHRKIVNNF